MWSDPKSATAWAFAWLIVVVIAYLALRRPSAGQATPWLSRFSLPSVLIIAGLVRLVPAFWLPVGATYDIDSFGMVTDALLNGQEVYLAALGRHPYLPFQMYIMAAVAWLSQVSGLPYVTVIKLPAVTADVALTGLIYHAARKAGAGNRIASFLALFYALNPVSLLVTSYHGQFESVTLFLSVLAWYFYHFGRRVYTSATFLGFAILNKTWPVIMLPVVWIRLRDRRQLIIYPLIALGIPVLFTLLYIVVFSADPGPMLRRALTHRGVPGYWGPGAVLAPLGSIDATAQSLFDGLVVVRNLLLIAISLYTLWRTRGQLLLQAILTVILGILAVTVGFGIQWLVWPVPFAVLANEDKWLRWYSLAATLMLVVHLFGFHMYPWLFDWFQPPTVDWIMRLSALPAWFVVIAWTIQRLRQADIVHLATPSGDEAQV